MKNGKTRRKRGKILIEIGVVIILLFGIVTYIAGNMVVMSAFTTALSNRMVSLTNMKQEILLNMEEYEAIPWLIDYWKTHSKTLFERLEDEIISGSDYMLLPEDARTSMEEKVDDVLKQLHKRDIRTITSEEAESLYPGEQNVYAAECYIEIQDFFRSQHEVWNCGRIILTVPGGSDSEEIVIFDGSAEEGQIPLGQTEDGEVIRASVEREINTIMESDAKHIFTLPARDLEFASDLSTEEVRWSSVMKMYGLFSAEDIYQNLYFTEFTRTSVFTIMIIVAVVILVFLYLIVCRPLAEVKRCVSGYAKTKDVDEVTRNLSEIRSFNEIGVFADEFSALAREMDRYTREMARMAADEERAATELGVASDIQTQMLPRSFPSRRVLSLHAVMEPAKEVGGDFYDFYFADDDHLIMTVADVSDKGVPAALFMAVSRTILKNRTLMGGTPAEILEDVNNQLCEGNDNSMFVTAWHGILTISTGKLICANAGHENPCIRTGGEPFRLIKTRHGVVMGGVEGAKYVNEEFTLSPGDAVFVYTDGVPEANDADGEMFGEERLMAVLDTIPEEDTPQDILEKVREAVNEFAGDAPQFDDMTMLCVVLSKSHRIGQVCDS